MNKLIKVKVLGQYDYCNSTIILTNAPIEFIEKCEEKADPDIKEIVKELGRKVNIDEIPFYRKKDFINDLKNSGYVVYTIEDELTVTLDF